jgi:hypothetical protein
MDSCARCLPPHHVPAKMQEHTQHSTTHETQAAIKRLTHHGQDGAIEQVGEGTVPQIVAQPSHLHTQCVSFCNVELGLLVPQLAYERTCQVSDA